MSAHRRSRPRHGKVHRRYLDALLEFQAWCDYRGMPFKWSMIQALRQYRQRFNQTPAQVDEAVDEFVRQLKGER